MLVEPKLRSRRNAVIALALWVPASFAHYFFAAPVRAEGLSEYEVKAAFLLNFTKFVEWPASAFPEPKSPLTICILGKDPFGRTLDELVAGEDVSGRPLAVRRITRPPEPGACQVLFLAKGTGDVADVLRGLRRDVLTVGDRPDFLLQGGMIAFVLDNRRVRFDINQTAAEAAGLKLSSRLLMVARSVGKQSRAF